MLANHVFWWLMHFYTSLLLLLQPSVQWLSIVNFNNDAKPPPKWILREFDVSRIRPRPGGLPHLETFTWQNLTPAERVGGTWEIIWTGGLPLLSELPHLPGVPHLDVNRPLTSKGLFTRKWGTSGRWGNPLRWRNPPVHIISHFDGITFTC